MKVSWAELDRVVSEEILRDDGIRRRVAESGRPLRSHATAMSDDDLLAKLRGLGVDTDHSQPLLIAGRGVPWPGLWLTTPGTVPEAAEAALDPRS